MEADHLGPARLILEVAEHGVPNVVPQLLHALGLGEYGLTESAGCQSAVRVISSSIRNTNSLIMPSPCPAA